MKLVVHVDGGARGNPGPAAAASVLSTADGEVVGEHAELLGTATNNAKAGCPVSRVLNAKITMDAKLEA